MTRTVPTSMTEGWKSQAKIGARRPVVRATIHRQNLIPFEYDTAWSQGGSFERDRHRSGYFTSFIFGDNSPYRELRNIQSCDWERSVEQDAATCTITLLNSELTAIGEGRANPTSPDEYDKPGWFTFNRGDRPNRWGHDDETGWNGIIVPDMVVKTYEGYGTQPDTSPPLDPFLVQSGTWMIDKVTYGADGSITLEMRDLARLLLDQIVFPPAIPNSEYPLTWSKTRSENVSARDAKGGRWQDELKKIGKATSSNEAYVGKGLTNAPFSRYVGGNGGVDGHHASHAIMAHQGDDLDLFWRSTGQDAKNDFVWWEFEADSKVPLAGVRLRMQGGPYRIYISVHDGDGWVGRKKIPWSKNGNAGSPGDVNIGAKIPFVASKIADRSNQFDVILPRKYLAKRVRITFTKLHQSYVGEHPFRAGLREFKIYTADNLSDLSFGKGEVLKVVGNYGDYTHIIKWVCAWSGWFWPPHSTDKDFIRVQPGGGEGAQKDYVTYAVADPTLPKGRVWGDFMRSGTAGEADLTVEMFDKKPMMDIINYVRDLLGFLFFIDETGGVVWRMPNLWSLGNYTSPEVMGDGRPGKRGRGGRTSEIVTIDEEETLLSYETVLDSTNIRERIFVANAVGGLGTVIKGFNPNPVGLRRVAGWSDQNFNTKRETKVMADMISARSMFTYRQGMLTTPGYPKIQIDDQIRIFERVTNETYYHYVMSIKSSLNMQEGVWTYDLQTHWLGEEPEDAWVVKVEQMDQVTKNYLNAIGYTPTGDEDNS